jgi:hypothetical protein
MLRSLLKDWSKVQRPKSSLPEGMEVVLWTRLALPIAAAANGEDQYERTSNLVPRD